MRTHQWMTAFLSGAVLFLGSWKAEAQYPSGSGYAAYTPISAQVPEGFNPYPTISPYDHTFSETYNENGHWLFNSHNNTQYRYYAGIEALIARGAPPNEAKVGLDKKIHQMYFDFGDMAILNGVPPFGRTALPSTLSDIFEGAGPYAPTNTGFMAAPHMNGFMARFGVDNPNGQTFEINGMGIFPGSSHWEHGVPILRVGPLGGPSDVTIYVQDFIYGNPQEALDGVSSGPDNVIITDIVDLDAVGAFNPGIPFDDGSVLGAVARMDMYQKKTYQSEVYGAQATVLQMPSREVGPFSVRPLFGVRYLDTASTFGVEGHDSGLDYTVNPDFANRDALLPGGLEEFDFPDDIIRNPHRMYLSSTVETQLGGPEMGWRYTAGGENFSLEGETRIGVMGAREKIKVSSKGFGQAFFINDADPPDGFGGFNIFYDEDLTTFAEQVNAFVTPTFQQSINTTTRPFAYIPVLRSVPMFREANFKAGYTILATLQLSRPENSIIYQSGNGVDPTGFFTPPGDPTLIPETRVDRSFWFVQYFNLGLEWIY